MGEQLMDDNHYRMLGLIENYKKQVWQLEDEMQKYIYVAIMADCYVVLKPEHELHESIRQDLLASVQALKDSK